MKDMKTVKLMKGRAKNADVAVRLRRARSVRDSDRRDLASTQNGLVGSLSLTDRGAAVGGRHVSIFCPPFMFFVVFMPFMFCPQAHCTSVCA